MGSYEDRWLGCTNCWTWGKRMANMPPDVTPLCDVDGVGVLCPDCLDNFTAIHDEIDEKEEAAAKEEAAQPKAKVQRSTIADEQHKEEADASKEAAAKEEAAQPKTKVQRSTITNYVQRCMCNEQEDPIEEQHLAAVCALQTWIPQFWRSKVRELKREAIKLGISPQGKDKEALIDSLIEYHRYWMVGRKRWHRYRTLAA